MPSVGSQIVIGIAANLITGGGALALKLLLAKLRPQGKVNVRMAKATRRPDGSEDLTWMSASGTGKAVSEAIDAALRDREEQDGGAATS